MRGESEETVDTLLSHEKILTYRYHQVVGVYGGDLYAPSSQTISGPSLIFRVED